MPQPKMLIIIISFCGFIQQHVHFMFYILQYLEGNLCHQFNSQKGISVILPSQILTVGQRFLKLLATTDWVKDSVVAETISLTWEKRVW